MKYKHSNENEIHEILTSRINFIKNILEENNVKTFITGAFGCGVFKNKPQEVAKIMKEVFSNSSLEKVIYAIPDYNNGSIFENVINS